MHLAAIVAATGGRPRSAYLQRVDFRQLAVGACASLPAGLQLARASSATVQTSASTVVTSGITSDVARIGQRGAAGTRGLVIEEARTNLVQDSRALGAASWTAGTVPTSTNNTGPDGTASAERTSIASGGFSNFASYAVSGNHVGSEWCRANSGTTTCQLATSVAENGTARETVTTDWQRIATPVTTTSTRYMVPVDGRGSGVVPGGVAAARDCWTDLHQLEAGSWCSEAIVTSGGTATRAGERLYTESPAVWVEGGRLQLELTLMPKGTRSAYSADLRLWTAGSDYAEIDNATGALVVSIGGETNTLSGVSWDQYETVELWLAAGGGLATECVYRVDGGLLRRLTVTGDPLGDVDTSGDLDLCCSSTTKQLSCWLQTVGAMRSGRAPSWAALVNPGGVVGDLPTPTGPRKVLLLGDSVFAGSGGVPPVADLMPGDVHSLADTGDTIADQLAALAASEFDGDEAVTDVVLGASNADLVAGAEPEEVLQRLLDAVDDIIASCPNARVYISAPTPAREYWEDGLGNGAPAQLTRWSAVVEALGSTGIAGAVTSRAVSDALNDGSAALIAGAGSVDGGHPGLAGAQIIADTLAAQLELPPE